MALREQGINKATEFEREELKKETGENCVMRRFRIFSPHQT